MEHVVNRALAIKPDDALAIYFQGYVLKRLRQNLDQALVAFERAVAIDPNLAVAHNYVGQLKVFLGRANEAAEHTLKAIQLSPRDPQLAEWYYQVALTYVHQRRYNEAVEWARRGVQVNPNLRYPYRVLAVALALSGGSRRPARSRRRCCAGIPRSRLPHFSIASRGPIRSIAPVRSARSRECGSPASRSELGWQGAWRASGRLRGPPDISSSKIGSFSNAAGWAQIFRCNERSSSNPPP
jgi:tetratricopeptide (TPR) repeat protein